MSSIPGYTLQLFHLSSPYCRAAAVARCQPLHPSAEQLPQGTGVRGAVDGSSCSLTKAESTALAACTPQRPAAPGPPPKPGAGQSAR